MHRPETHDLSHVSTNFGGNVVAVPVAYVPLSDESHLMPLLRFAHHEGIRLAMRGSGHSFRKEALCASGLVIGCVDPHSGPRLLGNGRVEIPASMTWAAVERSLNASGRSVPVLTSELRTSVGGTLAAGGFGAASLRWGAQAHMIDRLLVVRPDGRQDELTAGSEAFQHAMFTAGRLCAIQRVVLRTTRCPVRTWLRVRMLPRLTDLVKVAETLTRPAGLQVDAFVGQHFEGRFVSTEANYDYVDTLHGRPLARRGWISAPQWHLRSLRETRRNPWNGRSKYLWADYVVGLDHAPSMAAFIERYVIGSAMYHRYGGRVLVLAVRQPERLSRFPFSPIAPSMSDMALGFGVYLRVPRDDRAGSAAVQRLLRMLLEHCVTEGGRPYLAGYHDLSERLARQIWRDDYVAFAERRARADPFGRFNVGGALDF